MNRFWAEKFPGYQTLQGQNYSRFYLWREIKNNGLRILGKSISPHSFRHSFCTNMLIQGKNSLKAVSQYVVHATTSVTADMYIHDELKPEDIF